MTEEPAIATRMAGSGSGPRRGLLMIGAALVISAVAGCGLAAVGPPTPIAASTAPTPGDRLTAQTFGPMCAQFPTRALAGSFDSLSTRPVADAATASVFTQRLSAAIHNAGLTTSLDQRPAVTLFAPYDAAFDQYAKRLGAEQFRSLLTDRAAVTGLLNNHITEGRLDRQALLDSGTVPTLGGGRLRINTDGDMLRITDDAGDTAHVLCGNIQTSNATVYLIDRVLPPGPAQHASRQ